MPPDTDKSNDRLLVSSASGALKKVQRRMMTFFGRDAIFLTASPHHKEMYRRRNRHDKILFAHPHHCFAVLDCARP
jgi:hypothetical protein